MPFSNTVEAQINNYIWRNDGEILGGNNYFQFILCKAEPTESNFSEADYGGYGRILVERSGNYFSSPANDGYATVQNLTEIRFPTVVSGSNTITHLAIIAQDSFLIAYGQLTQSKTFNVDDRPVFEIGAIKFRFI